MVEILMVDDDEGDTLLATEALAEAKFINNLHIVRDGMEALTFLEQKDEHKDAPRPDLILLDLNMPRMNGHEVLAWIKANDSLKAIPIIILTTSSSEKDIIECYKNQANCFITKPVDLQQFNKVVTHIDQFWTAVVQLPPNT